MSTFIAIMLSAVLTDNFITKQTYGICPFLGVSKKTSGALGMGIAVTVVMALATLVTYPLYIFMKPLGFAFLEIIFFIFVIASLVQMLEKIIQKLSPSLYNAMGIYLPLITTNCAVLGVTELVIGDNFLKSIGAVGEMNPGWAVLYAVFAGLGFTLVMFIMSGLREKLSYYKLPKAVSGFPIAMITASFICMAFMVFSYI